jgi:hypothetical protein
MPPLQTYLLRWPNGTNIALTDSIPLLAIPAKLLRRILPPGFHTIFWFLAIAWCLQPVAAVFALRSAGEKRLLPSLAVAVITLSMPTLLYRSLAGHEALNRARPEDSGRNPGDAKTRGLGSPRAGIGSGSRQGAQAGDFPPYTMSEAPKGQGNAPQALRSRRENRSMRVLSRCANCAFGLPPRRPCRRACGARPCERQRTRCCAEQSFGPEIIRVYNGPFVLQRKVNI